MAVLDRFLSGFDSLILSCSQAVYSWIQLFGFLLTLCSFFACFDSDIAHRAFSRQ